MKSRHPASGGLVYSTEAGRMCPVCRAAVAACACREAAAAPKPDGPVRVGRQTKGRAGKAVTLVDGLALDAAGLADLAKRLKSTCGSGGTVKDGTVEIQGDHVARVVAWLQGEGWQVRRSGG